MRGLYFKKVIMGIAIYIGYRIPRKYKKYLKNAVDAYYERLLAYYRNDL